MLITGIIIAVLLVYAIIIYNGWVTLSEAVINNFKSIGVQLDARGKVIDSMVNISDKYIGHESKVFIQLAELRAASVSARTPLDKQRIESEIDKIVSPAGINLMVENYPELRSSDIFLRSQEAIVSEEQKLMSSKRAYNNSIEDLKVSTEKFPNVVFYGFVGGKARETLRTHVYWDISEEKRQTEEEKRFS